METYREPTASRVDSVSTPHTSDVTASLVRSEDNLTDTGVSQRAPTCAKELNENVAVSTPHGDEIRDTHRNSTFKAIKETDAVITSDNYAVRTPRPPPVNNSREPNDT